MKRLSGLLAGALLAASLHAQDDVPELFHDIKGPQPVRALQEEVEAASAARVRSRLVRLNLDAIDPERPGAEARGRLRLNLFPGLDPEVERTRGANRGEPGSFYWFGRPSRDPAADVVLSVIDGRVSGSLSLREGFFQIRHLEGDLHEVVEIVYDRSQPIDDSVPAPPTLPQFEQAKSAVGPSTAAAVGDPVVDVLVVYTPDARRAAGGSQKIQDRIQLAVAEANASFVNSLAGMEYRLVGMAEMDISGTPAPSSSFLTQVTQNEPQLQSLRNYYGADMVSVWVGSTAGGVVGIGWLNPGPPWNFSTHAYNVVAAQYAGGPFYAFAHEGGHNLGGAHDRAHAANPGAFAYSYGYQHKPSSGTGFYTIMAYSGGCTGCVSANRWSNPDLLLNGAPTGAPQGSSTAADNAATLRQIAPSVSQFRATQYPPANNPPTAHNQTRSVISTVSAPITLTGSDPDGHTLFFDVLTQPVHGVLSGTGASLSYLGALGYEGPDGFTFQVRDHLGGFDIGAVTLNVAKPATVPPVVSLATPAGGPFSSPATINLTATATDPDGSVAEVRFYANGALIGTSTSQTSAFTLAWTNVPAGAYSVTAQAVDDLGAMTMSNAVNVTVAPGVAAGYTTRMSLLHYAYDEGAGLTVFDKVGSNHGAIGGSAAWAPPGLKGGWVNSGASSFGANRLSAASGDAYTLIWVGKLDTSTNYQALFSMAGSNGSNALLRFYSPNGLLYLNVNGNGANYFNAGSLLGKNVMIALRCASGACSWKVGANGSWVNANIGSTVASSPVLQVGADFPRWYPLGNTTSALFWAYGDALSNQEIEANFHYAGAALSARGVTLDGYTGPPANTPPSVSLATPAGAPFAAPASINLSATASDSDGSVTQVQFFANGSPIGLGTPSSGAFTFAWSNVAAGTYSVFARATDNAGATADSAPVNVAVNAPLTGGGSGGYTSRAALLHYAYDEGAGLTVLDKIGSNHGAIGGSAAWAPPGLKGGWVNSGASSFGANRLSAASGDAYTLIWVGKLDTSTNYQALFSMAGSNGSNALLRFYSPNGLLYLNVNGNGANYFNAGPLLGKNVMIALRCASGACAWKVGANGSWVNANVGATVAASPLLQVGADFRRWYPLGNTTSALFWVYGDALSNQEIEANFHYAGAVLGARGQALDGYAVLNNSNPVAQNATVKTSADRWAYVYLRGSDPDGDPLSYAVTSGPSHGALSSTSFAFHIYRPNAGWTGTDRIDFEARDGKGGVSSGTITVVVEPNETITTIISTSEELRGKLRDAKPGETILLAPGDYKASSFSATDWGLSGTATHPITFRAQDPSNPPTIQASLLLPGSSWLVFESLRFVQPSFHNINIYPYNGSESHDITLRNLHFESLPELTGAANVKITRSDNVHVLDSTFHGWGDNAIDTIGLWGGTIQNNRFLGRTGFAQRTALQLKGDTRDVLVRDNYFLNAGQRVVQIGGGTGAQFFREPPRFEAQRIEVVGNRISGGNACFSLATQTGSRIHHNTCYLPQTWIARLLDENAALELNQNGRFDHNLFVYSGSINREFVNLAISGRVDLGSFVFDSNAYFQVDGNSTFLPNLPVVETNMIDQIDPQLVNAGLPSMRIGSSNPVFAGIGADAVNPAR